MGLEKATISNLQTGESVSVMFNPDEYALDAANSFAEIGIPGLSSAPIQYIHGNARTLRMELFFDTYETYGASGDVRKQTRRITALLEQDPFTQAPPILLFSWGGLNFRCVLESVGQRFTMFAPDGSPVRATLSVSFREFAAAEIELQRGLFGAPTIPSTMARRYTARAGDTLSKVAGELLGDPAAWREIAELNAIDNPRRLAPGTALVLPRRRRGQRA